MVDMTPRYRLLLLLLLDETGEEDFSINATFRAKN